MERLELQNSESRIEIFGVLHAIDTKKMFIFLGNFRPQWCESTRWRLREWKTSSRINAVQNCGTGSQWRKTMRYFTSSTGPYDLSCTPMHLCLLNLFNSSKMSHENSYVGRSRNMLHKKAEKKHEPSNTISTS